MGAGRTKPSRSRLSALGADELHDPGEGFADGGDNPRPSNADNVGDPSPSDAHDVGDPGPGDADNVGHPRPSNTDDIGHPYPCIASPGAWPPGATLVVAFVAGLGAGE
jgi:hypothetical protein